MDVLTAVLSAIFTPEVLTALAEAVIGIAGTVLTAVLVAGFHVLRTKLGADQYAYLQNVANIAVHAAEQAGVNGWVGDKKAYALDVAAHELNSHGIGVSATQLDAAIEAAVQKAWFTSADTESPAINLTTGPIGSGPESAPSAA